MRVTGAGEGGLGPEAAGSFLGAVPALTPPGETLEWHGLVRLVRLERMEKVRSRDLEEAQEIQTLMLPLAPLRLGPLTVAHRFLPAAEVGGDFLDYFALPGGRAGLYLGDVCGKGLPAALYGALAAGTLRGMHKVGRDPSELVGHLNQRLTLRGIRRRYTTVQYAAWDPEARALRLTSAGMAGPFHFTPRGCTELELAALPPGMFAEAAYSDLTLPVAPGEAVVFCTDGVLEAMDPDLEEFGAGRLTALGEAGVPGTAEGLLDRIFAAVAAFTRGAPQHDDMAVVVFHLTEA